MTNHISLEDAARAMREALRETVKRHRIFYLIQGLLMCLGGFLALVYPVFSSVAVVVLLGWLLIFTGIVQGISLIGARSVPHYWLQLLSVVLSVLVGLLLIGDPGDGLFTISFLLIVFLMLEGISKVIFALTIKPFPKWGYLLLSGLVSIVLSVVLWSSMPVGAAWFLGVLVGITLLSEGAALTYLAWSVHRP